MKNFSKGGGRTIKMLRFVLLFVLLIIFVQQNHVDAQKEKALIDFIKRSYFQFNTILNKAVTPLVRKHRQRLLNMDKAFAPLQYEKLPCNLSLPTRSNKVPSNAHEVRPGDIDIIGAIGDSITAGFGVSATDLLEVLVENRGRSFSAGGEGTWQTSLTLPNIIKVFNPNLYGFSTNYAVSEDPDARLNLAEGFHTSSEMLYLAKRLVNRMLSDPKISITKDWKMITLMVGDNDFCFEICYLKNPYEALENHKKDLLEVLRLLKTLPRTIVNIIPPPSLEVIWKFKNKPDACIFVNMFECPCIFGPVQQEVIITLIDIMKKWQKMDVEIANSQEFDLDDFTILGHRFTIDFMFPETKSGSTDYSYLAPDCFHLSEKGQAALAFELWNSIMESYYNKTTFVRHSMDEMRCPTEDQPFIPTRRNSRWKLTEKL